MKLILRVCKDRKQSAVAARFYPFHFTTTCHEGNSTLTPDGVCKLGFSTEETAEFGAKLGYKFEDFLARTE